MPHRSRNGFFESLFPRNPALAFACLLTLLLYACTANVAMSAPSAPTVFYVATTGNDAWSGKLAAPNSSRTDGPFASLERAKSAVRALHPNGSPLSKPATVYVRGGTYNLFQVLTFGPQDSGTATAPVTYAAYAGEKPVISGGAKVTGWGRYQGDDLPSAIAGQVWVAQIPQVASGSWTFRQLFVNGERRVRARTPNVGSYKLADGWTSSYPYPAQFKFHDGDMSSAWSGGEVEVVMLQNWGENRNLLTRVDASSRTATLAGAYGPAGLEQNARYWVENTLDALDTPGEWYLDRKNGLLYYYPLPGEDVTKATIVAPYTGRLVQFQGNPAASQYVSYIQISGLTFSYTDWFVAVTGHAAQAAFDVPAAISGIGVRSCAIQKSTFQHLGGYAMEFGQGSQNVVVSGNEMSDLGAGGVKIGDPAVPTSTALETRNNQVNDNFIHDIGEVFPSAVGVWVGQSANNTIAHNEIYNTYYSAISVGWTWGLGASAASGNQIQWNDIHDIGRGLLSDLACVYTLGVQTGTTVSYNVCHEVSRAAYGGWGIYLDNGSSNITIASNLVYATEDGAFLSGQDSQSATLKNNIFALGETAQMWRAGATAKPSFSFTGNIVYWEKGEFLTGWTWIAWLDGNYTFDNNLYYCPGDCPTMGNPTFSSWWPQWLAFGQDAHSIRADPLFVDPKHGDFRLGANSPASRIGFQPFDLSTSGPRATYLP